MKDVFGAGGRPAKYNFPDSVGTARYKYSLSYNIKYASKKLVKVT